MLGIINLSSMATTSNGWIVELKFMGACLFSNWKYKTSRLYNLECPNLEVMWVYVWPARLPRGVSCIVTATIYHPPSSDDNEILEYLIASLTRVESLYLLSLPTLPMLSNNNHDFSCVGVMYSGEYDACDVTLSVYPHRASLKNMPGGNRTYDLWNTSPMLCQLSYAVWSVRVCDISEQNLVPSISML